MTIKKCVQLAFVAFVSCLSASFLTAKTLAQQSNITPDNTLGTESSRLNRNIQINGINADTIDGGARRDSNLFHSFSEFNINDGQAVYFVNPDGVENILTRVTGGNQSNIFGTLGVDGAANLFLINPNGIVFGENASLDLQGSFVGTTASGLQFGKQGNFSATNPEVPGSLTVNPSALFFNQVQANGGIINQSQAPAGLRVPDGKSLLLVGGDINLDGGSLTALEGNIELASFNVPGTVGLNISGDTFSLNIPEEVGRGDISLTNQSVISVFGAGGGNLTVNARSLEISNSFIFAGIGLNLQNPNAQAGDVNLNTTNSIEIKNGAAIDNSVNSQGNGGDIRIIASELLLKNGGYLSTLNSGSGNAGNIFLDVRDTITFDGVASNGFVSRAGTFASNGNAGNIDVKTSSLFLTNGGQMDTGALAQENADSITNAGNITINARDTVKIDGDNSGLFTNLSSGKGKGGDIQITTNSLSVTNSAQLFAITDSEGNAGNININARDRVTFDEAGFAFTLVNTNGIGNGGNIQVTTDSFFLTNGSQINSDTFGKGDAGNIEINATDLITLSNFGSIISNVNSGAEGKGGQIKLNAGSIDLNNDSQIAASTFGKGNAGEIELDATDLITLSNSSSIRSIVGIGAEGKGGQIKLNTGSFDLNNNGRISVSTFGKGNAGEIEINSRDSITITNSSLIDTNVSAGAEGKGGLIDINTQTLKLIDGSQITSSVFGKGKGGEININASESVNLSGFDSTGFPSGIITETRRGASGDAGNITVTTNNFNLQDNAIVNAITFNDSKAGNITFNANNFAVTNGANVNTSTYNSGKAGNINLNIKDKITLSGNDLPTGLFASTSPESTGKGGSIIIDPRLVIIENGAGVSVGSSGTGDAGDITLQAGTLQLNNGFITAQTASTQGGDINLQISELLLLRNQSQITTTAGTAQAGGDGGNINVNSKFIVSIPEENSDITANAFAGNGGKVNINSNGIFGIETQQSLTNKSDITASSETGISGETNINTADTSSIQNSFTELSPNIDTDAIIANSCIVRGNKRQENSFQITGSGALPSNRPGNVLVSEYITGEVRNIDSFNQVWKKGDRIVEPQGLYRMKNGELLLSRECTN